MNANSPIKYKEIELNENTREYIKCQMEAEARVRLQVNQLEQQIGMLNLRLEELKSHIAYRDELLEYLREDLAFTKAAFTKILGNIDGTDSK